MRPRVLVLYYSFTNQTKRVADAMSEAFQAAGCEVVLMPIKLVDERYTLDVPLCPFWRKLLKLILPQLCGGIGKIEFDQELLTEHYDLVCIGSPTWWFYPAIPITTFLKSDHASNVLEHKCFAIFTVCRAFWRANYRAVRRLASRAGGKLVDSAAFVFRGNQVQSMFAFLSYLQSGQDRERYMGCRIYPFGVTAEGIEKAKAFATDLAGNIERTEETT